MLSFHRQEVVYPSDTDIADFDLNTDVEEYNYDGRLVFRGNLDPVYSDDEFQVYWLYDESNQRVGLAEHHGENHTCYWIRDNVYSTSFRKTGGHAETVRSGTLWLLRHTKTVCATAGQRWTLFVHEPRSRLFVPKMS